MRRWRGGTTGLVLALATTACGFLPGVGPGMGPGGEMEQVGPRSELGPIPVFDAEGEAEAGGSAAFFRTRDGWCFESDGGGMCAGGAPLPGEFTGFAGSQSEDQTCVNAVTGKEVRRLRVRPGNRAAIVLAPLEGSQATPVNVFAACWRPGMPFDDIQGEDAT